MNSGAFTPRLRHGSLEVFRSKALVGARPVWDVCGGGEARLEMLQDCLSVPLSADPVDEFSKARFDHSLNRTRAIKPPSAVELEHGGSPCCC